MPFHLPSDQRKTAVIAGIVGEVMEWYDFALYGFMASILSELFFPAGHKVASLLATYGIFAAGFIMRPIGSALFGWFGDTVGRSKAMLLSVILMSFPTVLLGLLPTYAQIGVWAPVSLVTIRLLQGLSVGGEFSSSVTYLVETAPDGMRGLSGSYANVGSMGGMLLGSGVATAATILFAPAEMKNWGWRLPFVLAAVLGVVAVTLRRHLPHSKHFLNHDQGRGKTSPIREAVTVNLKETVQATLFASAYGAVFYLSLVYIPTWLREYVDVGSDAGMHYNTIATGLLILLVPVAGWISDRFVRRTRLLAVVFAAELLLAVPLHLWMKHGGVPALALSQIVLGLLIAFPCGIAPALFVELFPTRDRLSGYAIAFNLGLGVVGGATPMAATALISLTGFDLAPAFYMAFWAAVGIGALLWMSDRSREPLA
ncbi:MAG: MFS transporter [Desulfobacterales bacterium]|jgi:MHS family proline/betaine transporter-like MFS transporter